MRLLAPPAAEHGGRVPSEVNAFIGREQELARLRALQPGTRLLTLVGPGGVGKTRLAQRLGSELDSGYSDGAWWVDLSQVGDPSLVPQAFGDVLGVQEPGDSWVGELTRALRSHELLLVVDNCEHVAAATADLVGGLLRGCPGLSLLATSLQPLGVAGETTWRVPPLQVPEPPVTPPSAKELDRLTASGAVQLFVARVQAHLPDFELTPLNVEAVVDICRRLDGLPLALELVAARVEGLGLAEVARRLARGLDVASGAARTAPARQQTLRAALDWSWSLLDVREQTLLRRLAVFAGGCTLQAVAAVCGDDSGFSGDAAIDTLTQLVTKSLVVAEHHSTSVRYRLLETVRAYAQEKLAAAEETAALRRRHAAAVLRQAQPAPLEAIDSAQAAWLVPEEDNVRAALEWAVQCDEAEAGMHLAVAAYPMWMFTGHYAEGVTWFDRLVALPSAVDAPARALALGHSGQMHLVVGDYDVARARGGEALALAEAHGEAVTAALVLEMLGNVALQCGELGEARALHAVSAERKRALNSPRYVSNLLQLGLIGCECGDFDQVHELIREVELIARTRERPLYAAGALNLRALIAAGQGATTTAVRLFEQALEVRRPANDQQGIVKTLTSLGHVQVDLGQNAAALVSFGEAVDATRRSGERIRLVRALEGAARCISLENPDAAVRLAGVTDAQRRALGTLRWPSEAGFLESWLLGARQALGDAAFERAWEDGQASTLGQGVRLAEALLAEPVSPNVEPATVLSPREREVAVLLAGGLTNKQIAAELVVSPSTIRTHVEHVLIKLNLGTRAQIAVWASQHGLLR